MKGKYKIQNENDRMTTLETLKQRLLALTNRMSRYQRRQKQYQQNVDFVNTPNKLYDKIRNNKIPVITPPTKEQINDFWRPIFQTRKCYNKDATWLNEYKQSATTIVKSEYSPITTEEIKTATSKFNNWKSPGLDKIQNFWWKKLTNLHHKISSIFDHLVETTMQNWKTSSFLKHENGELKTDTIDITNGIFQGDSPLGLHFV